MSEIRVDNITDEAGTGKPGFPNGITATGAALTDPEITGGIYLGGTGSVNYLDDYEEGTWTASTQDQSGNVAHTDTGYYTKIGRQVTVTVRIGDPIDNVGNLNSGEDVRIFGVPFPASSQIPSTKGSVNFEDVNYQNTFGGATWFTASIGIDSFNFPRNVPSGNSKGLECQDLASNSGFAFTATYFTND